MSAKKIIFILSLFVCAIIGSTFLLSPKEKPKTEKVIPENTDNKAIIKYIDPNLYETIIQEFPFADYKTYTDLKCVEFIYPSVITDEDNITDFIVASENEVFYEKEKPSERIIFIKWYDKIYIRVDISCYYKDESTNPSSHYFEESAKQVLFELLEKENKEVYSVEDGVSYVECYDSVQKTTKSYNYYYISPGDPEIRAWVQYPEEFKEQFDLYIEEFEKTIKRKEIE